MAKKSMKNRELKRQLTVAKVRHQACSAQSDHRGSERKSRSTLGSYRSSAEATT